MNTGEEKALVAVAQDGPWQSGRVDSPLGWFGVAHVVPEDEAWLASEHDLDRPEPGWYMVTVDEAGSITSASATERVCRRWFARCQFEFACWDPDPDTDAARMHVVESPDLHHEARGCRTPYDLRVLVLPHLRDTDVDWSNVDWPVLHHLITKETER